MKIKHSILGRTYMLLFLLITAHIPLSAQILTNGDFESGGHGNGFFVHDYTVINPLTGVSSPGFYARTTDPALMNATFISGGDHTTGSGNMLVFDGSLLSNRFFWTTGNTGGAIGGFTAGTTYTFSFWIKSVSNAVTSDDTRASIGVFFVNATNINPANQNFLAPLPAEGWVNISYSFVATADNAMIRLKTNNPGPVGHDFAIDDFSITEGGLQFEGSYTFVNPTCPDSNDGSITVNLSGGTLPYLAYNLTGSATQTNTTGIFTGLGEGTYNVSGTDSSGATFSETGIILLAVNDFEVSVPTVICQGESTTLTASGGAGSYSWTANPADSSMSDPNNASVTVSPALTTTYTVTSGSVSSDINLIENGDFSQGDALFITEYTYVANPNPFGVQSAYSIVTNPNSWFTAFTSCGDHTTGNGNLMVFDGATDPTGNVITWSNQNLINVTPNTDYTFSYYVASVSPENPARLEVLINGVSMSAPVLAPGATCLWTEVSYNWNSGSSTTATIAIYNRNFASSGNDFALDDISLKETTTCLYTKTVIVTVTPPGNTPIFDVVDPICAGAQLSELPTTSNNGIIGTWSPALNNMTTTTYTFTPSSGQCAVPTTMTITANSAPQFTLSQGCNGVNYTVRVVEEAATNSVYVWYDYAGTQIGNNESMVITAAGIYELEITRGGCSRRESITVQSTSCGIQKGISANNDGVNDYFDLEAYNVRQLNIYNRYGTSIYTKTGYQNQWYGQSDSGTELPDGTYYYVIDFEDQNQKTGWIYLMRPR